MVNDDVFRWILLMGSITSFILSIVILFKSKQFYHLRFFGLLALVWSYGSFITANKNIDFLHNHPHFYGTVSSVSLLFFPLMYLHFKSYLSLKRIKIADMLFHFSPVFIFTVSISSFYFLDANNKLVLIEHSVPLWVTEIFYASNIFLAIIAVTYSILALRLITSFSTTHNIKGDIGNILDVFKRLIIINAVLWTFGFIGLLIRAFSLDIPFDFLKVFHLGVTILIIVVGIYALVYPERFKIDEITELPMAKSNTCQKINIDNLTFVEKTIPKQKEYSIETKRILDHLSIDKPYLNNELTLQTLSNELRMSKHLLSELINNELNMTFNDLINDFRVNEVLKIIESKEYKKYKLLQLAELAGFNSKTTFNRVFKSKTGKTPTEYIKDIE